MAEKVKFCGEFGGDFKRELEEQKLLGVEFEMEMVGAPWDNQMSKEI